MSKLNVCYLHNRYESGESESESDTGEVEEEDPERSVEYSIFKPPLYIQRYNAALEILKDEKWVNVMTRIVDLGCAECKFLKRLLDLPRVR